MSLRKKIKRGHAIKANCDESHPSRPTASPADSLCPPHYLRNKCSQIKQTLQSATAPLLLDSGDVDSETGQFCSGSCRWSKDEYGWADIQSSTVWEICESGDIKKYIFVHFDRNITELQRSREDNLAILSLRIILQSQRKHLCKWKMVFVHEFHLSAERLLQKRK